jgi:N-acetylglucosamine kinase-like BadF-type ATPase
LYRGILEEIFPSSRVQIETDAVISYAGAIGLEPGVLLIAGTGSIAIGRQPDGTMIRAGGWGPHFGDEGGGFWIGREAVRISLRSLDSGSDLEFARSIAAKLGVNSLPDVVSYWAAGTIGVPHIAGLFPSVVERWPAEPAAGILRAAAGHLKTLVETAVNRVGVTSCRICLSGSVAMHPVMRNLIGLQFDEPKASPEQGAILLASQM